MLFDIELLRGCVDEWYVPEPEYVPPPVLTEEPMAGVEPEWFVAGKTQVGVGAHGLWMSRCWNAANSLACRDAAAVGAAIGGAPSHELGAETRADQSKPSHSFSRSSRCEP